MHPPARRNGSIWLILVRQLIDLWSITARPRAWPWPQETSTVDRRKNEFYRKSLVRGFEAAIPYVMTTKMVGATISMRRSPMVPETQYEDNLSYTCLKIFPFQRPLISPELYMPQDLSSSKIIDFTNLAPRWVVGFTNLASIFQPWSDQSWGQRMIRASFSKTLSTVANSWSC